MPHAASGNYLAPPHQPRHAIPYAVPYYAHTATQPNGSPDPDETKWQLLSDHGIQFNGFH